MFADKKQVASNQALFFEQNRYKVGSAVLKNDETNPFIGHAVAPFNSLKGVLGFSPSNKFEGATLKPWRMKNPILKHKKSRKNDGVSLRPTTRNKEKSQIWKIKK